MVAEECRSCVPISTESSGRDDSQRERDLSSTKRPVPVGKEQREGAREGFCSRRGGSIVLLHKAVRAWDGGSGLSPMGATAATPMTEGRTAAHTRQPDSDRRALARCAADGNGAGMFFHDLLHGRETQA